MGSGLAMHSVTVTDLGSLRARDSVRVRDWGLLLVLGSATYLAKAMEPDSGLSSAQDWGLVLRSETVMVIELNPLMAKGWVTDLSMAQAMD